MKTKLTTVGVILITSIAMVACNQQQTNTTSQASEKKIYLQLYSLYHDIRKDFDATIKAVADIGYSGVEVIDYSDGMFYNMTPELFKQKLDEVGLVPLSSHTVKPLAENIADTDWEEIWQWWDTAISAHKTAGMKYIVFPSIPQPKTLEDLQAYCDYMNLAGEKCNEAGIRFGYHNHSHEFNKVEDKIILDYMIKNTDPEKVFFQMDVYWTVRGGKSPVEYFETYPGRFELLHIKDHKELGQSGMVGFDAIFNNIEKAGTKYIIVEADNFSFSPLESMKVSYDYLIESMFVKNDYSN